MIREPDVERYIIMIRKCKYNDLTQLYHPLAQQLSLTRVEEDRGHELKTVIKKPGGEVPAFNTLTVHDIIFNSNSSLFPIKIITQSGRQ